jgi:hypothetical protein
LQFFSAKCLILILFFLIKHVKIYQDQHHDSISSSYLFELSCRLLVDPVRESSTAAQSSHVQRSSDVRRESSVGAQHNALQSYVSQLRDAASELDQAAALVAQLQSSHQTIAACTAEIRSACADLLDQQRALLADADATRSRLVKIEEADQVTAHMGTLQLEATTAFAVLGESEVQPKINPALPITIPMPVVAPLDFVGLLRRLDESLALFATHIPFKDLPLYQTRFRQAHGRVVAVLQTHFSAVMQAASARMAAQRKVKPAADADPALATTSSLIEFRAIATHLRPLLMAISEWSVHGSTHISAAEYRQLLGECLTNYYNQRFTVLCAELGAHLQSLPTTMSFSDVTRSACLFLVQLGSFEFRLFADFFLHVSAGADRKSVRGGVGSASETFTDLLENVAHALHALLRPGIIRLGDVDSLSEVAAVLRFEILEDRLLIPGGAPPEVELVNAPFAFVVRKMLQDVQERLVYRAQMYIRDRVQNYKMTVADTELIVARATGKEVDSGKKDAEKSTDGDTASLARRQQWHPTLENTLTLFAKLHRCLEVPVFRRLAQDALSVCTNSLLKVAQWIRSAQGTLRGAEMTATDADLFLIKNLLVLREQIAPFDIVDTKFTQKTLDFTRMREKISAVLFRRASLMSFLQEDGADGAAPLVAERAIDTTRDMERELKQVCDQFIRRETGALIGGLLSFLAKLATPASATALFGEGEAGRVQAEVLIEAILQETTRAFPDGPRALSAKLAAYLANPVTEKILLKPIKVRNFVLKLLLFRRVSHGNVASDQRLGHI